MSAIFELFLVKVLEPPTKNPPLLSVEAILKPLIAELLTPEEPDADPEPLIPSLPKSSVRFIGPPDEAAFFPPVKNERNAASG